MRKIAFFVALVGVSVIGIVFALGKRRMICPKCKRKMQGNWKYCPYDGAKTEAKYEWE